jgi:hypothetical protein
MKSKYLENIGSFHFGQLLKTYIDKRKVAKSALARKIKRKDSTIIHYQNSASVQVAIVHELCHALKHNFFADIAAQLPSTYTSNVSIDDSKDLRIAQLENELAISKAKYEALAEVMKGK